MAINDPSSSSIVEAITIYKKKTGKLLLTNSVLKWIPKDGAGGGAEVVSIDFPRLHSLFSSREGGPKVILKIVAKAISTSPTPTDGSNPASTGEETYNFAFTSSDPLSDRETFKKHISEIILQNRGQGQASQAPTQPTDGTEIPKNPPTDDNRIASDKGKAVNPLEDWRLKKRVLQNHPDLRQLHKEMVIGGQISEGEFWDGREELLYHEARRDAQKTGRSAQMVDPRPETTDSGEIRISITPQMIKDIFEQYPVVQKAYNENVPPLNDQTFWTRYFRSKLFNRHRSSARQSGDAVKEDEIFDKYLGDDDDGIEPKQINTREVFKLLDLAATQEDHAETGNSNDWTMRAGTQRSSLPLMRRFNEHSQRLLDSSLGKVPERRCGGVIDGGDAGSRNYYGETDLEDLNAPTEPERIILDMREQERYFEGSAVASQSSKRKRTAEEDAQIIDQMADRLTKGWRFELGKFKIPKDQVNQSTRLMLDNISIRSEQERGFNEDSMPKDFLTQMVSTYTTTNEFLRQFWTAILPNPMPVSPAISLSTSTAQGTMTKEEEEQKRLLMMPKPPLTAEQKALKAQRMVGFLSKTNERIQGLIQTAHQIDGFNKSNVILAFQGLLKSVDVAQKYYKDRTS
ncbi:RNA polymerase II transcription factor B subunit 1 [Puccinia graminis f. sp. tritici]|uniref:RNA polymerase II transcription factor B subunit 1 n=1 Tax=Puccinia graminis f. sp. tritici TaxID=56615 RepID=A0A5B0RS51_PUCGR|nr:RNA polymerase II transcription factor B subunit 1 [Puccinia graminis f. sp. tritici]